MTDDLVVSWDDVYQLSKQLAEQINKKITPTRIICIARGGLIPAGIIAQQLRIRDVQSVSVTSYHYRLRQQTEIVNFPHLPDDKKQTIVIDDLADTGRTIEHIRRYFPDAHYGCLFVKPQGSSFVDSFVDSVPQDRWIVFPWE